MITETFIAALDKKLEAVSKASLILDIATQTHHKQLERIFETGVKASGKIGSYSTKAMYAGAKQFSNGGSSTWW